MVLFVRRIVSWLFASSPKIAVIRLAGRLLSSWAVPGLQSRVRSPTNYLACIGTDSQRISTSVRGKGGSFNFDRSSLRDYAAAVAYNVRYHCVETRARNCRLYLAILAESSP